MVIMGEFESEEGFEQYRDNSVHVEIRDRDIIPFAKSRTSTQIWYSEHQYYAYYIKVL
jgi:hypothetical protein